MKTNGKGAIQNNAQKNVNMGKLLSEMAGSVIKIKRVSTNEKNNNTVFLEYTGVLTDKT